MNEARGSRQFLPISRRDQDAASLYRGLGNLPTTAGNPALILLSGLPGSGKSYFCQRLAHLAPPLIILESDALRAVLFSHPTH